MLKVIDAIIKNGNKKLEWGDQGGGGRNQSAQSVTALCSLCGEEGSLTSSKGIIRLRACHFVKATLLS